MEYYKHCYNFLKNQKRIFLSIIEASNKKHVDDIWVRCELKLSDFVRFEGDRNFLKNIGKQERNIISNN